MELLTEILESPSKNFLVHGPPGTGKSTLLVDRAIAYAYIKHLGHLDDILDLNMTVASKDQKVRVFESHRSRLGMFGEFHSCTFHRLASLICNNKRQDTSTDRIFAEAVDVLRNNPQALNTHPFLKTARFIQIDACEDATEPMRCLLSELYQFKRRILGQTCTFLLMGDPQQKTTWFKGTNRLLTGDLFDCTYAPLVFESRRMTANYRIKTHLQLEFLNALSVALAEADSSSRNEVIKQVLPPPTAVDVQVSEVGIYPVRTFVIGTEELDPLTVQRVYLPIIMQYVKLLESLPPADPQRYVLVMTKYKHDQYGGLLNTLTSELKKRAVYTAMICNSQSNTDNVSHKDLYGKAIARKAQVIFSTIETAKGLSPAFAGLLDFDCNLGKGSTLLPTQREWHGNIKGAIWAALSRPRYGMFLVARTALHPILSEYFSIPFRHASGKLAVAEPKVCRETPEMGLYPRKMAVTKLITNMEHFSVQEILRKHTYWVDRVGEYRAPFTPLAPPRFDRPEFDSIAGLVAEYLVVFYMTAGSFLPDPAPACRLLIEEDTANGLPYMQVWGCVADALGPYINCLVPKEDVEAIIGALPEHKRWWFKAADYADPVLILPRKHGFTDLGPFEEEVTALCRQYYTVVGEVVAKNIRVFGWRHMYSIVQRLLINAVAERGNFHLLGNDTDIQKLTSYFSNLDVLEGIKQQCEKIKELLRGLRNNNELAWKTQFAITPGITARHHPLTELTCKVDLVNLESEDQYSSYRLLTEIKFTTQDWSESHQLQLLLYGAGKWASQEGICRTDDCLYYNSRTGTFRYGHFVVENPAEVKRIVQEEMEKCLVADGV